MLLCPNLAIGNLVPGFYHPCCEELIFTPCLVSSDGLIGFGAREYVAVIILFFAFSLLFLACFWAGGGVM